MDTYRLAIANIGRDKSTTFRRGAVMRLGKLLRGDTFLLLCEVDEGDSGDELAWIQLAFPGQVVMNAGRREVMVLPKGWKTSEEHWDFVHRGLKHVTPARGVSVGVAQGPKSWQTLGLVSIHPVAGHDTNPGQIHEAKRDEFWNAYWRAVKVWVAKLLVRDITTVVGGDSNDPDCPLPHNTAKRLVKAGIDVLDVVEASGGVRVIQRGKPQRIELGIDNHACHVVEVELRPRSLWIRTQGEHFNKAKGELWAARRQAVKAGATKLAADTLAIIEQIKRDVRWFKVRRK